MKKKSVFLKNWQKNLLQLGVLLALIVFITGLVRSTEPADPEKYCPVGGLEAFTTYLVNGSLPCSMSSVQIMMGLVLAAAVILFSKLFCGYLCPVGTVEDLMTRLRKAVHFKAIRLRNGSIADSLLRAIKYILLFWIFYMTATASELFCKNLDPYYAVATGFKGEITLWMSIVTLTLVIVGGFLIDRFWCKYLCPLGAISNSLKFWEWIAVLFLIYWILDIIGLHIPWFWLLGAFCLLGYLLEILCRKPKLQLLHIVKDENVCNHCGACSKHCPYGINLEKFGSSINHVDCTLCGDCVAACTTRALNVGVTKPTHNGITKYLPAILTVVLFTVAVIAGNQFELPTIDEKWGIENVDESVLETCEIEGLRSVKCYGSSMAFKARLEQIPGVYGVKTYVNHHRVVITYDPAKITPERIQELIFVPSNFRVNSPDPAEVSQVKVITFRTENMYDKMDINYLGLQMRITDKKIYGLETEFGCPLIVRMYMDPDETVDKAWLKNITEMKELEMPVHGGGSKIIPVDFKFVSLEEGESLISIEEYLKKMFKGFKAEFKSRVEAAEGKAQFIYEIPDQNYEKPIILRNMPFVSNHLSRHDGIIGIYLNLNAELVPAIQIRYCEPMTEAEIWKLLTMDTWTITYKADDVREEPAKLSFKTPGHSLPYAVAE